MRREPLTIDSVESLYPLRQVVRRGGGKRFGGLRVAVPQLSAKENEAWQGRLERAYFACGCGEGAVLGTAALIAYGAWAVTRPAPLEWADALWLVVAFFLAAGLGKALGLARGRRRLAATFDEFRLLLERRRAHRPPLPQERPPEPPSEQLCAVGKGG